MNYYGIYIGFLLVLFLCMILNEKQNNVEVQNISVGNIKNETCSEIKSNLTYSFYNPDTKEVTTKDSGIPIHTVIPCK